MREKAVWLVSTVEKVSTPRLRRPEEIEKRVSVSFDEVL